MDDLDDAEFVAAASAAERGFDRRAPITSSNGASKVVQPTPQALPSRQGPSAILVATKQKGNPILNYVKNMPWEYSDIPSDYVLGATTCALFLSLKYHRLHPEYIYNRIRALGKLYNLRVLLVMVDIQNHEEALRELSKTSMINNLTLILSWSSQEAGRYLELFKSMEHANPSSIRAHQSETYQESLQEFITTPRSINKTDAASLMANFGSLKGAVNAQPEELALVTGWGEKKVKIWYGSVRENFRVRRAARSDLVRMESTMEEGSETDGASSVSSPMPISLAVSRENSRVSLSRENTIPEPSTRRRRFEEIQPDDIDDEEISMFAKAEAAIVTPTPKTSVPLAGTKSKRPEPELADGVAAALAKLREKG